MMINFILCVIVLNIISVIGKSHIDFLDSSLRSTLKMTNKSIDIYRNLYEDLWFESADEELNRRQQEISETIKNVLENREVNIKNFLREKQNFFYKVYVDLVLSHPEGIDSKTLKQEARSYIVRTYGFDPFDPEISGTLNSGGLSRASQWASNVISNRQLDVREDIEVIRDDKRGVWLYPVSV